MGSKNYYYWKKKRHSAPDVPYNKLYEPIIVDGRVTMGAKVLFADIANLCKNRGKCCTASNNYFAKRYNVGIDTIKAWLTQLKEAGYIFSTGRRERKIYIDMQVVRNSYAYGVKITPEDATPIGVETTLYEKTAQKSSKSIDRKEDEAKN